MKKIMKTVQSSYLHLSNILSSQVEFLSQVIKSSFSIQLECLSSTSQLDSTLFQKNFNSTWYFSSRVLDLNLSTWLDAISLFVFSMRIFENDEKWVWNIIFILFCIVIMMLKHSDLIRERIVAWINVFAIAFLAHFAVLNSFLENCLTFCMISWYSLRFYFLMILLFLSHAWMYFVQSSTIQQFLFIHCMLLIIFVHFFVHSALIISCNLIQKVKISMIFFNAFSSYLMYSFMHQRFISWFNNDFDICSFRILINFFSFIVFQLQRNFYADSLQTLKSIIVYIDR